jgi:hypothetical protein
MPGISPHPPGTPRSTGWTPTIAGNTSEGESISDYLNSYDRELTKEGSKFALILYMSVNEMIIAKGAITEEGMAVRVIDKQSDYNCKFVREVTGYGTASPMIQIKNRAAKAGLTRFG